MGKINDSNHLHGRRATRSLLAMSLAASLAAFGCTTNQNLGNGTPTRSGPEVRTAPTSGVTTGGETTTPPPLPPPMTSSYTHTEALPAVTAKTTARSVARGTSGVIRRSPDEAAAIMAGRQALAGRYLGVVSPGFSNQQYVSANIQTGAFQNPALRTNPQITVNSSISSEPVPAVSSGAGEFVSGTATTAGTTASATVAGTGTTAAEAGIGTLPTVASSGIPTVTAASAGTGRTTVTGATSTGTTTTPATTSSAPLILTPIGSASGNVRVLRSTSGMTMTNVNSSSTARSTTPTTASGRNQ